MPTHWTYRDFSPTDGLFQGDIIAREPLLEVLGSVHRHFCDPKYLAFIVLTQTCDLVVRGAVCKAKHIALAVVRPLSSLVPVVLSELCSSPRPDLLPQDRRKTVEEFFHRVLNQNEQAEGWVYLHPDGDAGIAEPAVAMLRVSIALRAQEHYNLIRRGRCGRLDTEYRNKLGWLVGNLYSRIDTTDWSEKDGGKDEEKKIINQLLETPIGEHKPLWVPTAWIESARYKVKLAEVEFDRLHLVLKEHAPKPPLDVSLSEVERIVVKMGEEFTDELVETFGSHVSADPCLMPLLARHIADGMGMALELDAATARALESKFLSDARFSYQIRSDLSQAAKTFLALRGPRTIKHFVPMLEQLPIVANAAFARASSLCEESLGASYLSVKEVADATLSAVRLSVPIIEHLRLLAIAAIQASLPKRAVARLRNNPVYQRAMKSE